MTTRTLRSLLLAAGAAALLPGPAAAHGGHGPGVGLLDGLHRLLDLGHAGAATILLVGSVLAGAAWARRGRGARETRRG